MNTSLSKLLVLFTLIGCAKKQDPTPSLVGSWTLSNKQIIKTPDNGQPSTTLDIAAPQGHNVITTYTPNGKVTTIDTGFAAQYAPASYAFTNNILVVTYDNSGPVITYNVTELTANRLVLVSAYHDSGFSVLDTQISIR